MVGIPIELDEKISDELSQEGSIFTPKTSATNKKNFISIFLL